MAKISIITVSFNSEKTIEDTIKSVISQSARSDIEFIVIDGGSSDGTSSILAKYSGNIDLIISEPDSGIYDAMNKGFSVSSGEIIAYLNSDDVFCHDKVIESVLGCFSADNVDFVFSDIEIVNDCGEVIRYWKCNDKCSHSVVNMQIPHPGFFVKSYCLRELGVPFDTSYKIAADLKQQLLLIDVHKRRGSYMDECSVKMLTGGASTKSLKSILHGWKESARAYRESINKNPIYFLLVKLKVKLMQIKSVDFMANMVVIKNEK